MGDVDLGATLRDHTHNADEFNHLMYRTSRQANEKDPANIVARIVRNQDLF